MSEAYILGHIPVVETTGGPDPKIERVRWLHHSKASRPGPGPGKNHWRKGSLDPIPIPDEMQERMVTGLPRVARRAPVERYRAVLHDVLADALVSYRERGRIVWPESAWTRLKVLAWRSGDPTLTDLGGEDQLRRQVEALTRDVVERGERKQHLADDKKVVTGWHGH